MTELKDPREAVKASEVAIKAGDVDSMVNLYEPEAMFVSAPGQAATGSEATRQTIAGFLAAKPRFELNIGSFHQAADLALESYEWKLEGTDRDGMPMVLSGTGSAVLRRQADGRWLYVIDNPFPFD